MTFGGITRSVSPCGRWTFYNEKQLMTPEKFLQLAVDLGREPSRSVLTVVQINHATGTVSFASPPLTPSVDIDKAIGDYIDGWIRLVRKGNRRWRRRNVRARKDRRGW